MAKRNSKKSYLARPLDWPSGYATWLPERIVPIRRVGYTLVDLMRRGLIAAREVADFQKETLLADFAWRVVWADMDDRPDAESVANLLRDAEGIVIFVHGWAGSGEIWEELPARVLKENPKLVVLVPDINGFGGTPFSVGVPPIAKCDPPAIMRAIEHWLRVVGLHDKGKTLHKRPIIFVGHSMGGATLFFADTEHWQDGELGRIALAPALLMNDRQRQQFYQTVGTGIRISGWSALLDNLVERFIAPRLIEMLAGKGSSLRVREQHYHIFDVTPEGVIAQTFAAMGKLDAQFDQTKWTNFETYLAEKDVLVGLKPTYEFLTSIHFRPEQIRQVEGDHYFFSVGSHAEIGLNNRRQVIEDIITMHRKMRAALNKPARKKFPRAKK